MTKIVMTVTSTGILYTWMALDDGVCYGRDLYWYALYLGGTWSPDDQVWYNYDLYWYAVYLGGT